jgi:hypothetical protein
MIDHRIGPTMEADMSAAYIKYDDDDDDENDDDANSGIDR